MDEYYQVGEYYLVSGHETTVTFPQKLIEFRGSCGDRRCGRCPGLLVFESGQSACPLMPEGMTGVRFKKAPPTPAWRAMEKFVEALNGHKKRFKIELWDGREVLITVKKKEVDTKDL